MVANCAACTKTIRSSVLSIKCTRCDSFYHPLCVNISDRKLSEDLKLSWVCPLCHNKQPKKDNSNTPVRATAATAVSDVESVNALLREGGCKTPCSSSPTNLVTTDSDNGLATLTSEIKLLRGDIGEMKSHMLSLTEHIKQCFSRLDEHEKKLVETDNRLCLLEQRESELFMCRNKIVELRHELDIRAQANLRNEIEIAGINEFPEENPLHLVKTISQKIGVTFDFCDLDYVTRVGPRDRGIAGGTQDSSVNKAPRTLVVRFLRRHDREAFLKAGKSRRNLTCADIDVRGVTRNIYINERLTQENRQLFRSARRYAKSVDYKYCWVKNGTIYVRKREGNPAVAIKNTEELERLLGPSFSQHKS